jgi:2-iminobutanoate/2-iminopropanoate deaminase
MPSIQHFAPPPGIESPPLSVATRTGDLLTRPADVATMNALYAGAFGPPPYPARTTSVVQALPDPKMLIEIECVAALAGR